MRSNKKNEQNKIKTERKGFIYVKTYHFLKHCHGKRYWSSRNYLADVCSNANPTVCKLDRYTLTCITLICKLCFLLLDPCSSATGFSGEH